MDSREAEIAALKQEVKVLKEEIKNLTVKLCAIKTIVMYTNSVCSQKLSICKGDYNEDA